MIPRLTARARSRSLCRSAGMRRDLPDRPCRRLSAMSQTYWQGEAADEAVQADHAFIWKAMLETIDSDLAGKRALDAGCNRGGFLRLLVDQCGIAEGFGYDPAS